MSLHHLLGRDRLALSEVQWRCSRLHTWPRVACPWLSSLSRGEPLSFARANDLWVIVQWGGIYRALRSFPGPCSKPAIGLSLSAHITLCLCPPSAPTPTSQMATGDVKPLRLPLLQVWTCDANR